MADADQTLIIDQSYIDDGRVYDDGKTEPTRGQTADPTLTATWVEVAGTQEFVTVSIDKTASEELRATGDVVLARVNTATNAARSFPRNSKAIPDNLPEETLVGITNNVMTPFTAVVIDGMPMDKYTGYDWLFMRAAAKKEEKLDLTVSEAFRTPARQKFLIAERMDPTARDGLTPVGRVKGRAGPVDKNNKGGHLMGQALDINTGMSVQILQAALIRDTPAEDTLRAQYLTGNKKRSSPWSDKELERLIVRDLLRLAMTDFSYLDEAKCSATYIWLKDNAARFGFRRTVPTEAWHWAHPDSAIMTTDANIPTEELLVASVKATASGVVALQTAKSEATLILDRAVHDVSKAHERSVRMTRTTRQQLYIESAQVAVYHGAALKTIASKYENQLASMALPLPEYTEGAVEAQSFDYTTKRWGDRSLT